MIIYGVDNKFVESPSPHSIGLKNTMTIPNPGFDSNPLLQYEKTFWGRQGTFGMGCGCGCGKCGIGGLSFDGTGLLGTGLFSGDITTWGPSEIVASVIGMYAVYSMFHQAKQTKYRAIQVQGRRRKSKAARLRAQAKKLDEKGTSSLF